jgi:hypothetical protein
MPRHDIEQIVNGQRPQLIALEMISCHEMALLATGQQESTGSAVVRPVRQELQGEERVGGAAPCAGSAR